MILYSSEYAPNPKKVLIYIAEKGLKDIDIVNLDLAKLEHKTPEYKVIAPSPMEIASIEMWYSRVTFELMFPLMFGFRHTHPAMSEMEDQNEEYGLAQREVGKKSLKSFDKILDDREFIAGDRFTYADLQMVVNLQFLVKLNRLNIEDYENLNDYVNQVSSRPSFSL